MTNKSSKVIESARSPGNQEMLTARRKVQRQSRKPIDQRQMRSDLRIVASRACTPCCSASDRARAPTLRRQRRARVNRRSMRPSCCDGD